MHLYLTVLHPRMVSFFSLCGCYASYCFLYVVLFWPAHSRIQVSDQKPEIAPEIVAVESRTIKSKCKIEVIHFIKFI